MCMECVMVPCISALTIVEERIRKLRSEQARLRKEDSGMVEEVFKEELPGMGVSGSLKQGGLMKIIPSSPPSTHLPIQS